MNQDLLRAILGGFPEEVAKQRSRDPIAKTCRDGYTAMTRLQGARGSRTEAKAGRKYDPPKAPSEPKGWNTIIQPWTSDGRAQKARGSAPQVLSFHPRKELKRDSGNWKIRKPSQKGLFKLMDGTKFKPDGKFVFSLIGHMGLTKPAPFVKGEINRLRFLCTSKE